MEVLARIPGNLKSEEQAAATVSMLNRQLGARPRP